MPGEGVVETIVLAGMPDNVTDAHHVQLRQLGLAPLFDSDGVLILARLLVVLR